MQNEFTTDKRLVQVYDSLMQYKKNYKLIWQDHENGLHNKIENSDYPTEVVNLPDGRFISFGTSNNQKVKEVVSRLPEISPIEFLLELRNIEGEIKIQNTILTLDWIKREHFPALFDLAEVNVKMPIISYLIGPPYGGNSLEVNSLKKASYAVLNNTIGYESIHFMRIYLKVKGGYPPSVYNNLDLIKEWYNSGKPKEAFKEMIDEYNKKVQQGESKK